MLGMELHPSVHMQHLNHGHTLGELTAQHHHYQHQIGDLQDKNKCKSKYCLHNKPHHYRLQWNSHLIINCIVSREAYI